MTTDTPATKDALEAFELLFTVDDETPESTAKDILNAVLNTHAETIRQALERQDAPMVTADEAQRALEWVRKYIFEAYEIPEDVGHAKTIRALLAERAVR